MKSYNQIMLIAAVAMLGACSEETPEPAEVTTGNKEVTFNCNFATTRATDTAFEEADKIGVYMTAEDESLQIGGNKLNNELFTFDGTVWRASRPVYWDSGRHNIYAYYPRQESIDDVLEYSFELPLDQSTHAGYTSADLVWAGKEGVEASASAVDLTFNHCMSRVIVKLEKSEEFKGEIPSDCEVLIHSTATTACVDLSTGDVSKAYGSPNYSIKTQKLANDKFQAIVVPQNIESRRPLVEVISQGISYLMEGKISMLPGYSYTLTVTLSKNPSQTKIEIGGTIGGWD